MQNGSKDPPKKTTSMKARLLTTLATLLLALTSWAYGVEIDGIHYLLNSPPQSPTAALPIASPRLETMLSMAAAA